MKAAYIEEPGPPDSIKFGDLPDPHLSGSQVLVQVAAVAVNPVDTYVRGGMIQMDLPRPFVVGCDLNQGRRTAGLSISGWRSCLGQ